MAKNDPYLRLTHANIIMNMLPKGRYSAMKDAEKAKHHEYIQKVRMVANGSTDVHRAHCRHAGWPCGLFCTFGVQSFVERVLLTGC